jgi:hypothetical protein
VLGFGVERRSRFIQDQEQRFVAHEATGERKLLPLSERHVHAAGPRRPELCVEARLQSQNDVLGAGATDGRGHRRRVVEAREIADSDRLPREKFESKKILKRAGLQPPVVASIRDNSVRDDDRAEIGSHLPVFTGWLLPALLPTLATTAPAGSVSDIVEHGRDVPDR